MSKERQHRREERERRERVKALNALTPRTIAYDVLERVDTQDGYANLLLPPVLSSYELSIPDKAFITDVVYGTLRWRLFLDRVIEVAHKKPLKTINGKLVNVVRIGAYQWLFMNGAPHACVSETVNLARKRVGKQTTGFVNALMHKIVRYDHHQWEVNLTSRIQKSDSDSGDAADSNVRIQRLSVRFSHPEWIVRELEKSWNAAGYETPDIRDTRLSPVEAMLAADNTAPEVTLCVRPQLADKQALIRQLDERGAAVTEGKISPYALRMRGMNPQAIDQVRTGHVGVEDEGSQLVALALACVPLSTGNEHEQWLDMCAGPGGKTALLAAVAQSKGHKLSANEPHEHRRELVADNLKAINSETIGEITGIDGREFGKMKPEAFDRILVDAPCSGLGALRRRPEARWRKTSSDIADLVTIQRGLLISALDAVKPGGVVAYVTCSPVLAETRDIVDGVLSVRNDVQRIDVPGVVHSINANVVVPKNESGEPRDMQLFEHIHDTDQMYIALLRKNKQTNR